MNEPEVLLLSGDASWIRMVEGLVRGVGTLRVASVADLEGAFAYKGWDRVALVLAHQRPSDRSSGLARLFRMLAASRRPIATIVLGDDLDEDAELDLLRRGAADCLRAPYDLDRLAYLVEVLTLRSRQAGAARPPAEVGETVAIWDESDATVIQARRVAGQDTTVLIRGEAGTGKSRLARIIHELSPRGRGPLVTLRCGTLTAEGFEEELFGGPPGSSPAPGAGKLGTAREGTLVLDDVDALSPSAQVALLRWVEDGSREPLPRAPGRPARARIVATTRVALGDRVAAGGFRSDLFFRLNVIGLELPPLRQRRVEIAAIASSVLAEVSGRSVTLAPETISALEGYSWPGNLRELRETLETATATARDVIRFEDLPESVRAEAARHAPRREPAATDAEGNATLAEAKREAEYHRITQALERNANNRLRTASELGISRMTLYKKLYKYRIIEPTGERNRRSPARPHAVDARHDPDDAGDSPPRGDAIPATAGDRRSASPKAPDPGVSRFGKSAPALH